MVFLLTQEARPILISAIEDCVYTFLWLTPAACPLNSTQQDECRVTNPATGRTFRHRPGSESTSCTRLSKYTFHHTRDAESSTLCPAGHLFDLSTLAKVGGYTVYDHRDQRKIFRLNICGNLLDAGCGPSAGACIPPALVLEFLSIL